MHPRILNMKLLFAVAVLLGAVSALTEGCEDQNDGCPGWKKYCSELIFVKKYCKKTCGLCAGGGGDGGDCNDKDKQGRCPRWNNFCRSHSYIKTNCRKTCGLCNGGGGGGGGAAEGEAGGRGSCGTRPHTRIVGGTQARPGDWPWQAQLRTSSGFPFCGGSLIFPRWIVSASHCFKSAINIRLGTHRRTGSVGNEQDFRAIRIIKHPSYQRPFGLAHDIMLLKLDKPARFNRYVHPVCLPSSISDVSPGKRCWITGFSALSSGGSSPNYLTQASVPVVSQAKCKQAYGSRIHDSMICAGLDEGGIDSCQGDSGGPMVCETGGRYYLHGATSWGVGCGGRGTYGVYARVKYGGIMRWIQETVQNN